MTEGLRGAAGAPDHLAALARGVKRVASDVPGLPGPLIEARGGYRSRPENALVPWLLRERAAERVIDLGAGSGVLGLLAANAVGAEALTLVEREPTHALLCHLNLGLTQAAAEVVEADLRTWTPAEPADVVLANPPFYRAGEGQPSRNLATRHATHAHFGDVGDFTRAAARALRPGGELWLLYPADRHCDALEALAAASLHARAFVFVHAPHRVGLGPYRVWTCAAHTPAPLRTCSLSCLAGSG